MLYFICSRFAKGKRLYEILALKLLINNTTPLLKSLKSILKHEYKQELSSQQENSLIHNLTNQFTISNEQAKFVHCVFIQPTINNTDNDYVISKQFALALQDNQFKMHLLDILSFALNRYQKYYTNNYPNTNLVLYQNTPMKKFAIYLIGHKKSIPTPWLAIFMTKPHILCLYL